MIIDVPPDPKPSQARMILQMLALQPMRRHRSHKAEIEMTSSETPLINAECDSSEPTGFLQRWLARDALIRIQGLVVGPRRVPD
jgi:hypothetical protein